MEEITESVDDVGFAEFVLDEGHDMREIGLAGVLAVYYLWGSHGSGGQEAPGDTRDEGACNVSHVRHRKFSARRCKIDTT
jgi:hypothetical protein